MTKGELLVSIIKSLGYNGAEFLDATNISDQDDYYEVTMNVCSSINRALTRMYDANKLPRKVFYIDKDTTSVVVGNSPRARYDLHSLISDYGKLYSIALENDLYGVIGANVTLRTEGQYIVVAPLKNEYERYAVTYTPVVSRINYEDSDTTTLPYTNELYDKVVYFVKSEFLEETNASLALYYRNVFEQYLAESDDEPTEVIRNVKDVYGMF